MALFGKKAKDSASDLAVEGATDDENGAGGVAVAEAPPAPASAKVKAARAPKTAKAVKNGVAVGLNIGNQFIKAVEVSSKNGELTVTAMGAVPTPPESYSNGNVLSVSALSGAIRDLWKGAGIKSKVAISSVAGTGALVVRVIEVPKMTDGELAANMQVDADRYIPFPPSEVVMDFKALRELPSDPDAPNMEVLLAAAQREIIDLHIQVVQKARLDPRAIDVEPIAAARSLQLERRSSGSDFIDYNEVTAIVNLGATGTEISILRGDTLVFTRVVPGGGNAITQAIADGMGMTFGDAERVKIESADAIAPAGYNAGGSGDFGFGQDADFEFGNGGDLNAAFDDISANPPATADDPFDLDFFNQNPQSEPGAGHAQKPNEPGDGPPPSFDFSDFSLDAPAAATPPVAALPDEVVAPSTNANSAGSSAGNAPINFNFGFDDLSDDDLPSMTTGESSPVVTSDKSTARLDESVAPPSQVVASNFGAPSGSAFDFDNFDLPATAEQPFADPTPLDLGATVPSSPAPVAFAFGDIEPPASSPLSIAKENESSGSDIAPLSATPEAPLSFETDPVSSDQAPLSFDFVAPQSVAPDATPAPTFEPPLAGNAPKADEFDLDAIFGSPATESANDSGALVSPAISLSKAPAEEFGAPTPPSAPIPGPGDFDLSGIDTGVGDDFGAGFGGNDNFTEFGAGLGASGAGADAAALYGLIHPALEELAGEVRRSLEFHLGRYPDATISRLVLLGGGARMRNLDVFLTQMIGVPSGVANPFAHLAVHTPKLAPAYASENGPLCAVALGLALRDFVD